MTAPSLQITVMVHAATFNAMKQDPDENTQVTFLQSCIKSQLS